MGNLGPGMFRSLCKGAKPCRFADHPTAPIIPVHRLVAIARNRWSRSIGIAGRDHPVRAVGPANPIDYMQGHEIRRTVKLPVCEEDGKASLGAWFGGASTGESQERVASADAAGGAGFLLAKLILG
jgi:hypothetical protein